MKRINCWIIGTFVLSCMLGYSCGALYNMNKYTTNLPAKAEVISCVKLDSSGQLFINYILEKEDGRILKVHEEVTSECFARESFLLNKK